MSQKKTVKIVILFAAFAGIVALFLGVQHFQRQQKGEAFYQKASMEISQRQYFNAKQTINKLSINAERWGVPKEKLEELQQRLKKGQRANIERVFKIATEDNTTHLLLADAKKFYAKYPQSQAARDLILQDYAQKFHRCPNLTCKQQIHLELAAYSPAMLKAFDDGLKEHIAKAGINSAKEKSIHKALWATLSQKPTLRYLQQKHPQQFKAQSAAWHVLESALITTDKKLFASQVYLTNFTTATRALRIDSTCASRLCTATLHDKQRALLITLTAPGPHAAIESIELSKSGKAAKGQAPSPKEFNLYAQKLAQLSFPKEKFKHDKTAKPVPVSEGAWTKVKDTSHFTWKTNNIPMGIQFYKDEFQMAWIGKPSTHVEAAPKPKTQKVNPAISNYLRDSSRTVNTYTPSQNTSSSSVIVVPGASRSIRSGSRSIQPNPFNSSSSSSRSGFNSGSRGFGK